MGQENWSDRGMFAEEKCTCVRDTFACVIIAIISQLTDWAKDATLFTHEIGHSLGYHVHDDKFYDLEDNNYFIMKKYVNKGAFIWSSNARESIMNHNNDCLELVENTSTSGNLKLSLTQLSSAQVKLRH